MHFTEGKTWYYVPGRAYLPFLNTPAKLTVYGKGQVREGQSRERQAGRLVPTKEIPQVVVLLIDYSQGSVIKGKSVRLRVGRWWHSLEGAVK